MFSSKNSILRINTDLNSEHTPDFTGDVQVNEDGESGDGQSPDNMLPLQFFSAAAQHTLCRIHKKMDSIRLNAEERRSKYFLPLSVGAIWNLVFGSIGLFNLQLSNSLFLYSITPWAKLVANQIWWFVVLIAGVGYGIVGFKNDKFRFFITFGAIGKVAFFVLVSYLWLNSTATDFAIIVATGDLIWAIYFFYFIFKTKEYGIF